MAEVNSIHLAGCNFFSNFEKFLVKCSSSGLTSEQLVDVTDSTRNVLEGGIDFWETIKSLAKNHEQQVIPSATFLATAQKVLVGSNRMLAKEMKDKYLEVGLPVYGFMSRGIRLKEKKIDWVSVVGGGVLLMLSIAIGFYLRVVDGVQYLIARIVVSLAAGLILTGFTKNQIKIDYKLKGTLITAMGSAAIFLLTYLINPAEVPKFDVPSVEKISKDIPK